jgi:hypothetical protein
MRSFFRALVLPALLGTTPGAPTPTPLLARRAGEDKKLAKKEQGKKKPNQPKQGQTPPATPKRAQGNKNKQQKKRPAKPSHHAEEKRSFQPLSKTTSDAITFATYNIASLGKSLKGKHDVTKV